MTDAAEVAQHADVVIAMIKEDQGTGQVPPDVWLLDAADQGGPWHVTWRRPDGRTQDIGKTVGYATQGEAQCIGREHLTAHGGGFHLRRA